LQLVTCVVCSKRRWVENARPKLLRLHGPVLAGKAFQGLIDVKGHLTRSPLFCRCRGGHLLEEYTLRQCFATGLPPKHPICEEICNHSSMRLQQHRHSGHCMGFHEQRKHWRNVPLQQKG